MGGGEKGKVERLIEEEESGRGRREGCDRGGEERGGAYGGIKRRVKEMANIG